MFGEARELLQDLLINVTNFFRDSHCFGALEAHVPDLFAQGPERPGAGVGHPVRVEQVVLNLLNNASKYTPRGGRIQVTVRKSGRSAEISVADNGMGLAPELQPRLFQIFQQGTQSLARHRGGLGIGLSVVRHLVSRHGGSVEAKSEGPDLSEALVRVFPDTNVLVSAFASRGICSDPLELVLLEHDLIVGQNVLQELRRALRRKIKLSATRTSEIVDFVAGEAAEVIAQAPPVEARVDADDALVLGEARSGQAELFVTGDQARLRVASVAGVQIVSPRQIWERLRGEKAS